MLNETSSSGARLCDPQQLALATHHRKLRRGLDPNGGHK